MALPLPLLDRFRRLVVEGRLLYHVLRDPRTPWRARAAAAAVLLYAVSPVDLLPELFLIGVLDDLVLVPLGLAGVRRLTPGHVYDDARAKVEGAERAERKARRAIALVVVAWVVTIVLVAAVLWRAFY